MVIRLLKVLLNSVLLVTVTGCSSVTIDKDFIEFGDGDSFCYRGVHIRVLGIDTPEIINEEHGIYEDQYMGREASEFTRKTLLSATTIQYIPYKRDSFGRLLAHVLVDGELLAVKLIKAGLAYETISYYGDSGFLLIAKKILKAADEMPEPPFENPRIWLRKHQRR